MHRCLNLRFDYAHPRDYPIHGNVLINEVRLESPGCDMVFAKVSLEVNVVHLSLCGEITVCGTLSHGCLQIVATALASVTVEVLDGLVQLVLEHLNGLDWVLNHEFCQPGICLSQLVHIDIESV